MKFKSLLLLPLLVASLHAATVDDLSFSLNGGGYSVTDCNELASDILDIPSSYNGLPVTSIGGEALKDCTRLTSISIPNTVIFIGDYAFKGCTSITSATISNSLNKIGDGTFEGCTSLSSIRIPSSVTIIGGSVFQGCTALTNINIPNSVTVIHGRAFKNCSSLTDITFEGTTAPTIIAASGIEYRLFENVPATQIYVPIGSSESYGSTYGGLSVSERDPNDETPIVLSVNERWDKITFENGEIVMVDRVNNLMWPFDISFGERVEWHQASSNVSNLSLAGFSDWRLPSFYELQTIDQGDQHLLFDDIPNAPENNRGIAYWANSGAPDIDADHPTLAGYYHLYGLNDGLWIVSKAHKVDGPTCYGWPTRDFYSDADDDGLHYYFETNTGVYVSETDTGTDPGNVDSDGDLVPDSLEITEGTDPNDESSYNSFSTNLLGYYSLDQTGKDLTGSGYNGVLQNATWGNDASMATAGNGSSSGLLIENGGERGFSGNSYAISGWVKINDASTAPPTNYYYMLYETGNLINTQDSAIGIGYSEHGIQVQISSLDDYPTGAQYFHGKYYKTNNQTPDTLQEGQWHHIYVGVEGNTVSAYVDGNILPNKDEAGSWNGTLPKVTNRNAAIGMLGNGLDYTYFTPNNSNIRDVRIYDRSLSASEVNSLFYSETQEFQIIEGDFTWQEAKADAESRGGRLAVLDTQTKIDTANTYLQSLGTWPVLWIGGTDQIVEGDWKWINGQDMVSPPWGLNEPEVNELGDQDYLAMWHDTPTNSAPLSWSDWAAGNGQTSQGGTTGAYLLEIVLDNDGDGLLDLVETNTGVYNSETDTGTDPGNLDSDGDGVSDGLEISQGTDPNYADDYLSFTFNEDSTELKVSNCDPSATGSLVIPSTYAGYQVTSIGDEAFAGCESLTSITIPGSVTKIGQRAFNACTGLTSIAIPNSVTSIGAFAFQNCSSLISITFDGDAPSFGTDVFTGSDSVTLYYDYVNSGWSSTVAGRPAVHSNDPLVFTLNGDGNGYRVNDCDIRASGSLEIPNIYNGLPVTSIWVSAFNGCSSITDVIIPEGITVINRIAFAGCTSLTSVSLPNTLNTIKYGAFIDCPNLATIEIPDSVTAIETAATNAPVEYINEIGYIFSTNRVNAYVVDFSNATSSEVVVPATIDGATVRSVTGNQDNSSLYDFESNNTVITSVTLPETVGYIGQYGFLHWTALTTINLPENLTSLVWMTFAGCSSLTSINISENLTDIDTTAFYKCSSLSEITVSADNPVYTSLDNSIYNKTLTSLFRSRSDVTSISLPSSVSTIGANAYSGCLGLTDITIPETITTVGIFSFGFCSNLTNVNYGSISSIDPGVFTNCTSLTSVHIPNSVTLIASQAFEYCTSLSSITIPNSVTFIAGNAFRGCSNLSNIRSEATFAPIILPDWWSGSLVSPFDGVAAQSIVVPNGSVQSYLDGGDGSSYGGLTVTEAILIFALNETGTGYSVTDCDTTASGSLDIPSTYNGLPVTSIAREAFAYCDQLTSITIPDSVTSIGDRAFRACTSLISITIGEGVITIGDNAFAYCSSLISVTIPDSVTSIGGSAFGSCSSLTSITFEVDAPTFGTEVFSGSDSVTVYYDSNYSGWSSTVSGRPAVQTNTLNFRQTNDYSGYILSDCLETAIGNLEIPSFYNGLPVTSIGDVAFYNCTRLTSIIIPDGVTSIGVAAFQGCTSLASITIPDGVTSIGDGAFLNCSSLTSISIPDRVTSIGVQAFYGCASLSSISIPDRVTSIGVQAFYGCASLSSISIPDRVTSIGDSAFYDCTSLTSVTIGKSVTSIGVYAFRDCSSLSSITIGESVTSIGDLAFTNCTSLTEITIPGSVTLIGESAFESCIGLVNITIADGVTTIGGNAFNYCTSLTSISIPDSVTSIGAGAFAGCFGLASITIPEGLTSIADAAFYSCSSLTSVNIPDSVTSIGDSAFEECTSLTSIVIPKSVTSIGDRAFYGCTNAGTCYFEGEAPTTIGTEVFNNIQTPYIIVGGSQAASYGSDGATFSGLIVVDYSKVATAANLYTSSDLNDAQIISRLEGQQDVTTNPNDYDLHTPAEMATARSEGQQDVISSPSNYDLVSKADVFDMRISQPGISMNVDKASIKFRIQSSNDLVEWSDEETIQRKYSMPVDKDFMRVSIGPSIEPEPLGTVATDTYGDRLVYDEFNKVYVNDESTPLVRSGVHLETNYYGWIFYAIESHNSGYLCILKKGAQNMLMNFSSEGNSESYSIVEDLSSYEEIFGQAL